MIKFSGITWVIFAFCSLSLAKLNADGPATTTTTGTNSASSRSSSTASAAASQGSSPDEQTGVHPGITGPGTTPPAGGAGTPQQLPHPSPAH